MRNARSTIVTIFTNLHIAIVKILKRKLDPVKTQLETLFIGMRLESNITDTSWCYNRFLVTQKYQRMKKP